SCVVLPSGEVSVGTGLNSLKNQREICGCPLFFETFSHRCAFLMIALENIAFEDALPHNKQAALRASYFIEDMLEEMSDIQTMLDAVVKTQG
ncbi:hypothetical protein, partial [Oceanospirillum beijerinckii]|uniref:hypothetical protein n=1 Tax=Oceanospirillum beijerinckii TaxID=64976 RepID=UPI0005673587